MFADSLQDRSVPFAETLEAMDKLHKAGKFKRLGLSNFTAFEVAEIAMTCEYNGWVRPTIYQGVYNCIQRGIEPELIPACHRYGLDVVALIVPSPAGCSRARSGTRTPCLPRDVSQTII